MERQILELKTVTLIAEYATTTVTQREQMENNPFQTREPNVANNDRIRTPQREAYEALADFASNPAEHGSLKSVLPIGYQVIAVRSHSNVLSAIVMSDPPPNWIPEMS